MFVTIKKSLFVLSTMLLAVGCDTADDDSATRVREVVTGAEVSRRTPSSPRSSSGRTRASPTAPARG